MFLARWIIDAKFGHKEEALKLCRKWDEEVGRRVGFQPKMRVLTGSIGTRESRLEFETIFPTLSALENAWAEMAKIPAHQKFGRELEQHVVSGTNRWEVLRIMEE